MPNYRFEFREHSAREVLDEIELESDAAAIAEATRTARELLSEGIFSGIDRKGWVIHVYTDQGKQIATIEFSQIVEKRGDLE